MADYEKYYKESIEVLTKYITDTRIIPTEKEWNKIAVKLSLIHISEPTRPY